MFLLNKKRIIFINFVILASIFYYGFSKNVSIQTKPVSSIPVSNHTIILDAGHGKPDRWCCWR